MEKFTEALMKAFMPLANKMNKSVRINAMKEGFMLALPLIMVGSILTSLAALPFWDAIVSAELLSSVRDFLAPSNTFSNGIMALIVCVGISYNYARRIEINPIHAAMTALVTMLINIPTQVIPQEKGPAITTIDLSFIGSRAIFTAMLVSFLAVDIYAWAVKKKITIKMPAGVPQSISDSFTSFIPAGITMFLGLILRQVLLMTSFGNLTNLIVTVVQTPLKTLTLSYPAMLINGLLVNLCWFFGIHGQSLVGSVFNPTLQLASAENITALGAGLALPNLVTHSFALCWVTYGGWIAVPLLIALWMYRKKRSDWKDLFKIGILPGIFNIYEPLMFGIPLVLNPFMLIPMLITPLFTTTVGYFATKIGLIPFTTGITMPITIPLGISGAMATNSLMAGLLQLVCIIPLAAMWYFFLTVQYRSDIETGAYVEESNEEAGKQS